jgi:hypothetical protein
MKRIVIGIACLLLLVPLVVQTASLVHKFYDVEILHNLVVDNAVTAGTITVDNVAITGSLTGAGAVAHRGALAYTSDDQGLDNGVVTLVQFYDELYDTDEIFTKATDNTHLVVPDGVTKVRLSAYINVAPLDSADYGYAELIKNSGESFVGKFAFRLGTPAENSSGFGSAVSAVLSVSGGDTFSLRTTLYHASSSKISASSWFSMEIVQ